MNKPAIDRDALGNDVAAAAAILASISELATIAMQAGEDTATFLLAIETLADAAHDRLDLAVRALGNPGLGFRGRVAQRLDERGHE